MEFSEKQLQTLKERFATEKMQQVSNNTRSKRPRINKHHYEKVDITTIISESTTLNNTAKKALLKAIDIELNSMKKALAEIRGLDQI